MVIKSGLPFGFIDAAITGARIVQYNTNKNRAFLHLTRTYVLYILEALLFGFDLTRRCAMDFHCQLSERREQPVLVVRVRTPAQKLPELLGKHYQAIAAYLDQLGQTPAGPPFAAYYNMDMQDLDVEIGFPVTAGLPSEGEIQASVIPAGKSASCLYTGSYDQIAAAYTALAGWVEEQGLKPTGVAYEVYLNDPGETSSETLQTQIIFPLINSI
jgi:effector-binding domain-containing protein